MKTQTFSPGKYKIVVFKRPNTTDELPYGAEFTKNANVEIVPLAR